MLKSHEKLLNCPEKTSRCAQCLEPYETPLHVFLMLRVGVQGGVTKPRGAWNICSVPGVVVGKTKTRKGLHKLKRKRRKQTLLIEERRQE